MYSRFCMHGLSKERSGVRVKTVRLVRDPQNLDSLLFSSQTLATHVQDGTLCLAKLVLRRKKKTAVLESTVVAKLEIAGTIIYFSLLANKLLNHFEVSNLSFSIFCLSAGGGAAGASLMGAPALLGLLPQGGLIQASKEVGSHHSIKRVEWNIPHKKIPIWSVIYL